MINVDDIRGEGGDLVQVGIERQGVAVDEMTQEWTAALFRQIGVEVVERVDFGVFLAVVPALLADQLEREGWLRVETPDGVFVVEAEMP